MCVCASVGAWATTVEKNGTTITISTTSGDEDLSSADLSSLANTNPCTLVVNGAISQAGIDAIFHSFYNYESIVLDLSNATLIGSFSYISRIHKTDNYPVGAPKGIILPKGTPLPATSSIDPDDQKTSSTTNTFNPYYNYSWELQYVIAPSNDGTDATVYIPSAEKSGWTNGSKTKIGDSPSIPYLESSSITSVIVEYSSSIADENKTAVENYIYGTGTGQLGKDHAFDGIVTDIVGGSVKTGVATALDGKADSKVKNLTITSGTLTSGGADTDVEYINSLTGLQTLDISAATATADQIFDLLSSNATTITLSDAQKEQLKTVSGKTFTAEMLAKVGLTPTQLANGMTNTNYFVDGSTLIVTGVIDATVDGKIGTILTSNTGITTLDVANATNTTAYEITKKSGITTVSLPGSGNVTYDDDSAITLVDGVLSVTVGDGGQYANLAALKTALSSVCGQVEHLKITGNVSDWNEFASPSSNDILGCSNLKTVDLTGANYPTSGLPNTQNSTKTCVLLPAGTDLSADSYKGNINYFAVDGTNSSQLNVKVNYAEGLDNGAYFAESDDITILKSFNGNSASGGAGAKALSAFKSYEVGIVDLTSAQSNINQTDNTQAQSDAAKSDLANVKTVFSPLAGHDDKLVVDGPLTNDVLDALNNLASAGNIKSIDFSGATVASGTTLDWTKLSAYTSVEYIMLPASESASVSTLSTTTFPALKAAGALDGTDAYLHVYNNVETGATKGFDTEMADPFASATSIKLSSSVALNANSADLSSVISSTCTVVDISDAQFGSLDVATKLKVADNAASTTYLVVPDGLGTSAELKAYNVSGIGGVFSHNGEKLSMLAGTGTGAALAAAVAAVKTSTETTLSVNSADYREVGNGITPSYFNDVDIETLELNQTNYSSATIANTHIKNLLWTTAYAAYGDVKDFDISGCTNLEVADFTQQKAKTINAKGLENLTDLYLNKVTFTQALDKTKNPMEGVVDVTRTSGNYDGLLIHADADFNWERVVPSLDKNTHYSDAANTPFVYENATFALHEKTATDNYRYWYSENVADNNLVITMTNDLRGSLSDILDQVADKRYTKVTINGPITQADVAAFSKIKADILDLSGATMQRSTTDGEETTYTDDMTILQSSSAINDNVKFVVLPPTTTRDDLSLTYDATTETVKSTLLQGFTGLYTALAYNSTTNTMVTYVKEEGTLQPAVVAAGLGTIDAEGSFKPADSGTKQTYFPSLANLENLYLSGNVNAYDVTSNGVELDKDGHLRWNMPHAESVTPNPNRELDGGTGSLASYGGLNSASLKMLDMKWASFKQNTDMTVSVWNCVGASCTKCVISEVPTVKELPADFFNIHGNKIWAWCIPSNIEILRSRSFITADYIWTTPYLDGSGNSLDPEGDNTRLDNGYYPTEASWDNNTASYATDATTNEVNAGFSYVETTDNPRPFAGSFTFGSNIKLIETGFCPDSEPHVSDVYVLNTTAPECHVDAFSHVMYNGNGGFSPVIENGIITRKSYRNNGHAIAMLHYPRQTTDPQIQRYTDPTREYSIATGLRDGKGAIIYFPNHTEFQRAFNQGTYGYTWNAWDPTRDGNNAVLYGSMSMTADWNATSQAAANDLYDANTKVNDSEKKFYSFYDVTLGGVSKPTSLVEYYKVNWNTSSYTYSVAESGGNLYPQAETTDTDNDGMVTTKDYRGWHQFVLTAYAANTILEEEPYRSYITDNEWWTICPEFDITYEEAMMLFGTPATWTTGPQKKPYVSKLKYVRRMYSKDGNHQIFLNFSENLMELKEGGKDVGAQHGTLNGIGVMWQDANAVINSDDVIMSAGVPYLIKPNLTDFAGGINRQFRIMTSADYAKLTEEQKSSTSPRYIKSDNLYNKIKNAQEMKGTDQMAMIKSGTYTVPAFVSGRVNAQKKGYAVEKVVEENGSPKTFYISDSPYEKSEEWSYTFVGTFYKSFLPHYSYFLGWDSSLNGGKGGARFYYHDGKFDEIDNIMRWTNGTGVIVPNKKTDLDDNGKFRYSVTAAEGNEPAQWSLKEIFVTDDFGSTAGSRSSLAITFGSPDVESGSGDATGINEVKPGQNELPAEADVYTVGGQQVGKSVNGLKKGIYIVNGKKYVVK